MKTGSLRKEADASPIPRYEIGTYTHYRLSTNPEKVNPSIFYLTLLRKPERKIIKRKKKEKKKKGKTCSSKVYTR